MANEEKKVTNNFQSFDTLHPTIYIGEITYSVMLKVKK